MNFEDIEVLTQNYLNTVKSHFNETTVLIVDDSDITKPYSQKLEGLCRVKDGSTGEFVDGYWFAGVSRLHRIINSLFLSTVVYTRPQRKGTRAITQKP
jgi:hypothetical protein